MSVPTHQLDPPDDRTCLDCKLRELAHALSSVLEDAGVPLKYAKEIADEATDEAKAHFDPQDYRTCKECGYVERAD